MATEAETARERLRAALQQLDQLKKLFDAAALGLDAPALMRERDRLLRRLGEATLELVAPDASLPFRATDEMKILVTELLEIRRQLADPGPAVAQAVEELTGQRLP